jgi:hypothetical protein
MPAVQAAGPAGAAVMRQLTVVRKVPLVLAIVAGAAAAMVAIVIGAGINIPAANRMGAIAATMQRPEGSRRQPRARSSKGWRCA